MIMTVPQVLAIWVGHQAAGVSILSWSAYFVSALLWLWFGIRRHDKNVYLPCLGWIAVDGAVTREKDGKLRIVYAGWDNVSRSAERLRASSQRVEGRILPPPWGSADPPEKLGPPS
jgi:hypothetical protein